MAYYCWCCYARNDRESGLCAHCGDEISPPVAATEVERLEWGTRHPDPDVRVIATRRLGETADASVVSFLRDLIAHPPDPYVAAEAIHSLMNLSDACTEGDLLRRILTDGPVPAARAAKTALASFDRSAPT